MPSATLAAATLVALAVLTPWAHGATGPTATSLFTAAGLSVAGVVLLAGALRRGVVLPAVPLWPLLAFAALALLQLVPLPSALHARLAPGSWEVWWPSDPAAAAVLGHRAHAISLDPSGTLRSLALFAAVSLLAVLGAPALARRACLARCAAAVTLGGFAITAYAVFARARFGALLYGTTVVPTVAPFGPFVNKNHFAGWTSMAAVLVAGFAVGLAGEARRSRRGTAPAGTATAALALVASLAMALAVLASLSRGGVFALAAGVACLLLLVFRGSGVRSPAAVLSTALAVAVLGGILVFLAPASARERLRTLAGASFRFDTWRDTLRLAGASPLVGHGLGAFHDAYPRFKVGHGAERVEHAENDFLEVAAEGGAVGVAVAVAGIVLLVRRALRELRRHAVPAPSAREGEPAGMSRVLGGASHGGLAALAALSAHSLVDFDLRIPASAALAALAVAMVAAASGVRPKPLRPAIAGSLAAGSGLLLVATLSLPPAPWRRARDEIAEAMTARAVTLRTLRWERAEAALVQQLGLRPADAESWLTLAGVRRARGDAASARALARRAVWLDPGRQGLPEAAASLSAAGRSGGHAP